MEEQQNFIEAEQLCGQEGNISFREIVLRHLARITQLASKEFRGGYWNIIPISPNSNSTRDFYVEDSMDSYCNAIENLYDLLLPQLDKEAIEETEKLNTDLEGLYTKFDVEKLIAKQDASNLRFYRTKKVKLCRKLFQSLSKFLNRIKYMENKKFEE